MRYFIIVLFSFLSVSLAAQYEKGNWYLDANSGAGSTNNTEYFNDSYGFRLKGGYFLRDRLLIGAEVQNDNSMKWGLADPDGISLFARYYLPVLEGSRFSLFGEATLDLGFSDRFSTGLSIGGGAEYALTPNILLTANLTAGWGGRRGVIGDLTIGTNYVFGGGDNKESVTDYAHRKGDILLNANFGSLSSNGRFYLAGDLNLAGGYFLSKNLLVTGELGFYRAKYDLGIPQAERSLRLAEYSAATGLRYHFNNGKRLQPYLAAGLRYTYVSDKRNGWNEGPAGRTGTFTESSLRADLKAGFLYHLDPNIALDFSLKYQPVLSGADAVGSNRLGAQLGLKLFLGKR